MKILVVQDWLRSGGTERQSVFLANAFSARGHPTVLITFRPGGALASTVAPAVRHLALQPFDTRLDWFAPGLERVIRAEAPDVVLCMGRMANAQGGRLQRALPTAAVIGTMRTGKKLSRRFRASLHDVRHVVANSRDAARLLTQTYAVPPDKISVVYNSLVFPPATADTGGVRARLRQQFGATAATTVLLCVAMFRPEKNQRELIEIVAGLPMGTDVQLWLAGDGVTRGACAQRIRELGLDERVKLVGFHPDPTGLYAAADVAVHASWSESLSNFLIEAQAHGLVAIACEAQGITECFLPGRTGWMIPRDSLAPEVVRTTRDAFRTCLLAWMGEPAGARAQRSAAARAFARTTFEPQRQLEAYLELFSALSGPIPTHSASESPRSHPR